MRPFSGPRRRRRRKYVAAKRVSQSAPGLFQRSPKLKQRLIWREEFETLDQARAAIAGYIDRYHHRPHSSLAYRTPREVAATWQDHRDDLTTAA